MNSLELKKNIIQKITLIDDAESLKEIQALVNSHYSNSRKNSGSLPSLSDNKTDDNNDKEDFTDYIKEWIKEM